MIKLDTKKYSRKDLIARYEMTKIENVSAIGDSVALELTKCVFYI